MADVDTGKSGDTETYCTACGEWWPWEASALGASTQRKVRPMPDGRCRYWPGAARTFVAQYHRHHEPVIGHKFSLGVVDEEGKLRGAAIVGRPVARARDDGWTLEVTRLVTDGCPNACSALYAAAWRAAKAMGYTRIGTYILESEPGTSLKAADWKLIGSTPGRSWSVPSRPRIDKHPLGQRQLWEAS